MRSLVLAAVLAVAADAWGCSCATPTPAEQFRSAQLVFVGEVIDVDSRFHIVRRIWHLLAGRPDHHAPIYYGYEYTFAVERLWRGPGSKTIRVASSRDDNVCGFEFERGKRYLVYGFRADGEWQVTLCTRTRPADSAAEDLAYLNTRR